MVRPLVKFLDVTQNLLSNAADIILQSVKAVHFIPLGDNNVIMSNILLCPLTPLPNLKGHLSMVID